MKHRTRLMWSLACAIPSSMHLATTPTKTVLPLGGDPVKIGLEITASNLPRPSLNELLGPLAEVSSTKIVSCAAFLICLSGVVYRVATMKKEDTEKGLLGKHQWPLYLLTTLTGLAGLGMYLAP